MLRAEVYEGRDVVCTVGVPFSAFEQEELVGAPWVRRVVSCAAECRPVRTLPRRIAQEPLRRDLETSRALELNREEPVGRTGR